ncbi:hypothetical protein CVT25_013202 [Psilocybe cyanescens]|uniref:Uncharacterized protein n=1 Tax=Psilocybe cyanescens TaxID=93625 RepID=A0A409XLP5_PSICY|nr:hypothetical protein CVT25_013202 [Psilocybe cyanescens]
MEGVLGSPQRPPQIVYNNFNFISGDAYFCGPQAPQTTRRTTPASTPHSQGQSFPFRARNTRDQPTSGVQAEDVCDHGAANNRGSVAPVYDQAEEQKYEERTTTIHVDPATVPSPSPGIDAHRNPSSDTTPSSPFVRTESTGNSASTRPSMSHATTQTSESLDSKGRGDNTAGIEPAILADTARSTSPVGFSRPFPHMIAPPSDFINHGRKLVPGPASRVSQHPSPYDDNTACASVRKEDEVDAACEENQDRRRRTRSLWKRAVSKLGALLR